MKKIHTTVKYDGQAMAGKSIDVEALAPSLMALSELIKLFNRQLNGQESGVRVLVNADLQQNCFELNLEVVQQKWEKLAGLFGSDGMASAKNVMEWLGMLGSAGVGLFGLIKRLKGQQVESVKHTIVDGKNHVVIQIVGDNNVINVPTPVYEAYQNPVLRKKAVDVLAPLREEGYDTLQFYGKDGVYQEFHSEDVPEMEELPVVEPVNMVVSNNRVTVKIRKAAFEGNAKWTVMYRKAIEAAFLDIEWLAEYQSNRISAPPQSSLDVMLEERFITNDDGVQIDNAIYSIIKVYGVIPPPSQETLFGE
jgi:hypothetical protein